MSEFPDGFSGYVRQLSFSPVEREPKTPYKMNLTLLLCREATEVFGAVFTRNRMTGAPVIYNRNKMKEDAVRGILINNRIANVCAETGPDDINILLRTLDEKCGFPETQMLAASTGIIGWRLPVKEMCQAMNGFTDSACAADPLQVSQAVMTTDAYPKLFSVRVGSGSILGIAKGAGMIEPNLATMLVFIMTDIEIGRESFRKLIKEVSADTFNRISVDGDQSTSDMVIGMSSCLRKNPGNGQFREGLRKVCGFLAGHIVRNGEGTAHVIRAEIRGARTREEADRLSKGIVNSPLVKTAVSGNDPNLGRMLSALGDAAGNDDIELTPQNITLSLGRETVFTNGTFLLDAEKEIRLSNYLKHAAMEAGNNGFPPHEREVTITVEMNQGEEFGFALGSDLSAEYVKINADYRT